ncbi:hypothetical protein [Aristophania vespae]|uniref:hypothetical protein n=1 Tax=Aristophania vespae TaxID=2697033 RepID=UPI002351346E|nr:hypothetical protein [Aristophania vespae]UMM63993.1 hypothetical protein DM15PD_09730 [Aristophania vespae]
MKLHLLFSAALLTSSFALLPHAHAASSSCDDKGSTLLHRMANKQDCLNSGLDNKLNKYQENRQRQEQKLKDLRDKYENAPQNTREKLQKRIDQQREKLQNMRGDNEKKLRGKLDRFKEQRAERAEKLQKLKDQQKEDLQRLKQSGDRTRSDVHNLLHGGL